MYSQLAEIGMVEMVILAGAVLAFVVHPAMILLASIRATVLNLSQNPTTEKTRVAQTAAATN